jgi:phosphoglycolate phosphatase
VLWDADGTLIHNGGVSKEARRTRPAFTTLTGRPLEHPVMTEGRTDPAIMRSLLERHGIQPTPDLLALWGSRTPARDR